jgi:nitrogen-specific signal transduction histidine kinase
MRVMLVVKRHDEDPDIEAAAVATGSEIIRGHDIESAVHAAEKGEVDAVLVPASELLRIGSGEGQISSYLRHKIMSPLSTVLGFAELISMGVIKDEEMRNEKLAAIVKHAIRIRDLINHDGVDADHEGVDADHE